MDNFNQEDYLIREILEITEDLLNYIKENRSKADNEIQFKIVFNQLLKNFESKSRELILGTDISPNKKNQTIEKIIPLISEALLMFPSKFQGGDMWLDLTIASNFAILNVASQGRQNAKWRIQASANILSKLLMKSPRIEFNPDLDFSDLKKTSRMRNALVMTSGVYLESIITIYDIAKINFVEWSNNALFHFKEYWKFYQNLDIDNISQKYDLISDDLFLRLRFFLMPLWNSLVFILNVYRITGSNPPKGIDFHGYTSPGRNGVISLSQMITDEFSRAVSKSRKLFEDGIISKNDDPHQSNHIQRLIILADFSKLYRLQAEIYHRYFSEQGSVKNFQRLHNLAFDIYEQLEQLLDQSTDRFQSNLFAYYVDLYNLMLEYHAILPDERVKSIISQIEVNKEGHPELFSKAIKVGISHAIKNDQVDYHRDKFLDGLEFLISRYKYRYRELIDAKILKLHLLNHLGSNQFESELNQCKDDLDKEPIRSDLQSQVRNYLNLLGSVSTEQNSISKPEISLFDYNTWIDLDFSSSVPYYPFNQLKYQINEELV